jgi:transposase
MIWCNIAFKNTTRGMPHGTSSKVSKGLLGFGHSKDRRPDLLQFKQGLAMLDPGGYLLFGETMEGRVADDTRYVPAWREMVATTGHKNFLYVADCKAAALSTRGFIDHEGGSLLGEHPHPAQQFIFF